MHQQDALSILIVNNRTSSLLIPWEIFFQACKKIMLQKIFQQQNDLIGIVLYGTKHKGLSAQADHVTTLQDLAQPNADKIKELMTIVSGMLLFSINCGALCFLNCLCPSKQVMVRIC